MASQLFTGLSAGPIQTNNFNSQNKWSQVVPSPSAKSLLAFAPRHGTSAGLHVCAWGCRTCSRRLRAFSPAAFQHASADAADPPQSHLGPAAQATLRMLEWHHLCRQVARFSSTSLGRRAVSDLHVPASQAESEQLLAETQAVDALEAEYAVPLDFGGCQTEQTAEALKRASKGGMLTGPQALAVATMLVAAQRLQRAILSAAKQAGDSAAGVVLAPLTSLLKNLETHAEIVSLINGNIQDDGQVRDSASEEVRRTRGRVRALEGRLTNLLKGHGGEVTEQAGRMCVAVAASGGVPKGILLGSSPGGGMYYIEPSSAVPLNNDLGAARGEMFAAEEAVLWRLTSAVVDDRDDVQRCLDTVVWLDVAASRARYSRWVEGSFPTFVPLPSTGRSSAKAKRGNAKTRRASAGAAGDAAGDGDAGGGQEEDDKYVVRLRRLRHPLLLGEWLLHREATRRADKRATSRTSIRRLATRKSVMAGNGAGNGASAAGGSAAGSGSGSGSDGEEEGPSGPVQPVPIDVCVKPEMRAVIITGPNTGGKTASLKAFGLAVLMAKAGLAVPAMAPARLPCYSSVLADIGDEQSLSASLSTFSGHLHRIGAVRREADGKGVVLLDEVGTGTDPGEGAALGVALLRALVQGGRGSASFTLASTHHSALTSLKYEDPRFENASMEFDEQKLAPTYRLLWGIPGRSNALNIAARLGLHPEVVEGARQRLGTTKAEVDNVIVDLEELRRRYEADENAAEQAAKEAARIRSSVAKTRRKVMELDASLQLKEAEGINRAVEETRAKLNEIFRRQKVASHKQEQQQRQHSTKQQERREYQRQQDERWVPKVGDRVFVPRMNGSAKVVSIGGGEELVLQMGMLKVTAKVAEVRRP